MDKDRSAMKEEEGVKNNVQLVRKCIRPYFLSGGDYDDLYQEGMIGLLSALRTYDPGRSDNFQAYAALCIKRRVIDAVRRDNTLSRTSRATRELENTIDALPEGAFVDPEADILANESAQEIKAMLQGGLSPLEGRVLDGFLEGYTSSEIAGRLGRSRKSVDNAIRRIRRKVALYLNGRQ